MLHFLKADLSKIQQFFTKDSIILERDNLLTNNFSQREDAINFDPPLELQCTNSFTFNYTMLRNTVL